MWRFALMLTSLVGVVSTTDEVCSMQVPEKPQESGWFLATMSAAFLQIFRHQNISCTGEVSEWRFYSTTNPKGRLMPVLSIWEQTGSYPPTFKLVGTNKIVPADVTSEADNWYRVEIPAENRISVDSTKKQFMGLFYQNFASYDTLLHVSYYDRVSNQVSDPSQPNLTVVGSYAEPELLRVLEANDGVLPFNSDRIHFDVRIPLLQVRISPGKPVVRCGQPPVVSKAVLTNWPVGVAGDQANYLCDGGYLWAYYTQRDYICSDQGRWEGDGFCILSYRACLYPFAVGECYSPTLMWYYDDTDKMCKWFWYGGCGGTPNRFSSFGQCMDICSGLEEEIERNATSEAPPNGNNDYVEWHNRHIIAPWLAGY